MSEEQTGRVKFFNAAKGWGFLLHPAGTPDVFCHYSQIVGEGYRTLSQGERVTFELHVSERGPMAVNVRRCSP